jgi:hypothetical protein
MVNYSSFASYGQWTNRQLRDVEMRMIGAIRDIQSQASELGLNSEEYFANDGNSLSRSLSTVRDSIPDNASTVSTSTQDTHNELVVDFVEMSNVFNSDPITDTKPFLGKLADALISVPETVLGGAGESVGKGISATFDKLFKSLSPIVWVLIGLVVVVTLFTYVPPLRKLVSA